MADIPVVLTETYDFELDRVVDWVSKNGFKRVLLQGAPGLIIYLPQIAEKLRLTLGIHVSVDGRGRFGACDVEENLVGFDAVIHFGHTGFVKTPYPILYVPAFSKLDVSRLFPTILNMLSGINRVGLAASVQHVNVLPKLREYLSINGKSPFIGEPGKRCLFNGQVVGCDYLASMRIDSKVDAHIIISGGEFHALGLALSVSHPVLHVDPYIESVKWVSRSAVDKINRIRGFAAFILQTAKKVALVEITLPGQHTNLLVDKLESFLKKMKPTSQIDVYSVDVLSDQFLWGLKELGYEVVVTAGCTRFVTDDYDRSPLPIFEAREVYRLYLQGLNVDRGVFILQ